MNLIADETGISKGKVHYLITNWKQKIKLQDIDEIREFTVLVRKSNMSIQQCVQGFRMINMLKNLGVHDEDDNKDIGDIEDNNIKSSKYNELSIFIQDIYLKCKNLGITPSIISSWIKDLLDFHSIKNSDIFNNSFSLVEKDKAFDKKPMISADPIQAEKKTRYDQETNLDNDSDFNLKLKDESMLEIEIPFISRISYYISQKKKEFNKLENYIQALEKDTKTVESKRNQIDLEFEMVKQEQKYVMSFIDWYYDLKKELWDKYSIKIEDFEKFAKVINDFRNLDWDVPKIMEKYMTAISLDDKIKKETNEINNLYASKMELNKSVLYLQDQVNCHKQTMDIYRELEIREFGLKELKQLWNTIMEITKANNISGEETVSKFFKDIEKNYDDKLGFDKQLQEIKDELVLLSDKVVNCRNIIQSQPSIGPTLFNLLQKGINEQNIIEINHLIEILDNTHIENKNENSKNKISRSEHWKSFTDELKRYVDIKVVIKEQQAICEKLQKEVRYLDEQKQEIVRYLQAAISYINTLNNEISYLKGWMDQLNHNNRINLSSRFSQPFIFIIYKDKRKDDDYYS